ncbi:MAG: tagatose 1,6-diphosphate aldolase [Chloroflexota bacterium]
MKGYSIGKRRGLHCCANEAGIFTILALDHGDSLLKTIRPDAPNTVSFTEAVSIKATVLQTLASEASAVLLDPVYGLAPAILHGVLPGDTGLLLAVEDGDYATPQRPARLFESWHVEKIKRTGANAVKCFFYYHPNDHDLAQAQEAFVADLVDECRQQDLPLFAEPLSYNTPPADRPRVVVETARKISALGVDVLKVEFPVDIHHQPDEAVWLSACQALTDACQGIPWVLLSAGVDFEAFAKQVQIACQAGASGYLAGRAIWKEAVQLSGAAQQAFLEETARLRLQTLAQIATESATPWTAYYPYQTDVPPREWYQTY